MPGHIDWDCWAPAQAVCAASRVACRLSCLPALHTQGQSLLYILCIGIHYAVAMCNARGYGYHTPLTSGAALKEESRSLGCRKVGFFFLCRKTLFHISLSVVNLSAALASQPFSLKERFTSGDAVIRPCAGCWKCVHAHHETGMVRACVIKRQFKID